MKELFSHASPVFQVNNILASIEFYTEKLGFEKLFTWNDPVEYVVLGRGNVKIHLSKRSDDLTPSSQHTALYIFVHDVDKVYTEFAQRKLTSLTEPKNEDYKMREFQVKDPDGYIIAFGKGE